MRRSTREAWNELSDLYREYSGVSDEDGDELFAKAADISVDTATFMRKPGDEDMPPKGEVLTGVYHLLKVTPSLSIGKHTHMLNLVNECYKPARRQTAGPGFVTPCLTAVASRTILFSSVRLKRPWGNPRPFSILLVMRPLPSFARLLFLQNFLSKSYGFWCNLDVLIVRHYLHRLFNIKFYICS